MPLLGSRGGGSVRGFGRFGKSLINNFIDTFTRTASLILPWTAVRGTWTANGTAAATASSPSGYPITTIETDSANKTIEVIGITNGAGVSFWVTDSNNWWATTTTATESCQSCTTCSQFTQTSTGFYCAPGNNQNFYTQYCDGESFSLGSYSNGCGCRTNCYPGSYESVSCGSCVSCTENFTTTCAQFVTNPCNCTQSYFLRIIKSIAGTVTLVTSATVGTVVSAIRLITNGNSITAKAYSNTGMTTQTGSDLTSDGSSATKTGNHGIILEPSSYQQGTTISEFKVY
jgi:hypothetical protein